VAGPNSYKLHSYAELLHFGRLYVVCYGCRRYALVSKTLHGERDQGATTRSCCVCGSEGQTTQEAPGPHIREDTRANPQRHPRATSRLTGKPYRPSKAAQVRETAKDRRRERS
jgi:hypothetical protein